MFTVDKLENQYYRVMTAILESPNEPWPQCAKRLNLTKDELFDSYDYLDKEQYLSGMHFAKGGQNNEIRVPYVGNARITEKGVIFAKKMKTLVKQEALEIDKEIKNSSTVFVSYNENSGGEFVDVLEKEIGDQVHLIRYTNEIQEWGSFKNFMNSIRNQDFAILVITDEFLKSSACLYEVVSLMKDDNWKEKAMYIVLENTHIYSAEERADYIKWWNQKYESLDKKVKEIPLASAAELCRDLKICELIRNEIGEFLTVVADSRNPKPENAITAILHRIQNNSEEKGQS